MNHSWIVFSAAGALMSAALYHGLTVRSYTFATAKIEKPVRLILLADLHGCFYGENQSGILGKINSLRPDAVVMAGDMLDDALPAAGTTTLLSALSKKYPCYYAMGNHEVRRGGVNKIKKQVRLLGVTVLDGKSERLKTPSGGELIICGADDPMAGKKQFLRQLDAALRNNDQNRYTVLLSHRPELLPVYSKFGFDLALTGHAHGGQWRVPFLINGVFAPHQGLFPKYAGGAYHENGTDMVVSRGLAKNSAPPLPRIFNPPELVVVDIIPVM